MPHSYNPTSYRSVTISSSGGADPIQPEFRFRASVGMPSCGLLPNTHYLRLPHAHPERPEGMLSSNPYRHFVSLCLAFLLPLMLVAGLTGCGPASSNNEPSLGPNASMDGPPLSKQGSSPRTDAITLTANPISPASVNGLGSEAGSGTIPGGDNPRRLSVVLSDPGHPVE